jgi:hypothetical protein
MKSLTIISIVFILLSSIAFGQSPKYQEAMLKGLSSLANAKTSDEYLTTANSFERIAQIERKDWLPLYYSAYSNLTAGLFSKDNSFKDQYWDKALQQAQKADSLSANNSEIFTLKGHIQFMKATVDPQSRMSFFGTSAASLEKAKALNPDNPRPYLVQGQDTFYTPSAFGGGKKAAKPFLEIAVEKFAKFKTATELSPSWGAKQAQKLLAECE